jgi:hypothetical protein
VSPARLKLPHVPTKIDLGTCLCTFHRAVVVRIKDRARAYNPFKIGIKMITISADPSQKITILADSSDWIKVKVPRLEHYTYKAARALLRGVAQKRKVSRSRGMFCLTSC